MLTLAEHDSRPDPDQAARPDADAGVADALFASALQRSDHPTAAQVRQAIATAIRAYKLGGCAARVAQEYGEHPETAVTRMRWARMAVAAAFPGPGDTSRQPQLLAASGAVPGPRTATRSLTPAGRVGPRRPAY